MSKRSRSPSCIPFSSFASSSAHPLTIPVSVEGPGGDDEFEFDFNVQGSLDSEDWDEMVENEEMEEEEAGGGDVDEEEVKRELEWLEFEAANRPPQSQIDDMVAFLKERGLLTFIKTYVLQHRIPILHLLFAFDVNLPKSLRNPNIEDASLLPVLKMALSRILRRRTKLAHLNTWEQALSLIAESKKILVLTGAGISVSCGIPDFRSSEGLYARLKDEGKYELDDPQQMFDIAYFRENPKVFYSFASQIYPSNFVPSPCHRWIKLLEDKGKLLRNYTQNIDTLESLVGISASKTLQCHGSFATATCIQCSHHVPGKDIEKSVMRQEVPMCPECERVDREREREREGGAKKRKKGNGGKGKGKSGWGGGSSEEEEEVAGEWNGGGKRRPGRGVMKPDITFFGEKLDDRFDRCLFSDREEVDLLIIIGSSLQVAPVSEVLAHLPHSIPQILINKTPVKHFQPDINLLGDADAIMQLISSRLGWVLPPPPPPPPPPSPTSTNAATARSPSKPSAEPTRVGESHFWLFDGAEGGGYVDALRRAYEEDSEEEEEEEQQGGGEAGGEEGEESGSEEE
ncbi:DHS-like NAD/FAD-binding domain-containing protein [Mrakia frigida]|uniref:DHS-like NAD/FAD-binding domain-containing protein n=1 Tax=Mrakia frigida TaxID=29902 RepID=UPI003FCC0831